MFWGCSFLLAVPTVIADLLRQILHLIYFAKKIISDQKARFHLDIRLIEEPSMNDKTVFSDIYKTMKANTEVTTQKSKKNNVSLKLFKYVLFLEPQTFSMITKCRQVRLESLFLGLTVCGKACKKLFVAARLRKLRSDDPLSKGNPRSIKQGLEL